MIRLEIYRMDNGIYHAAEMRSPALEGGENPWQYVGTAELQDTEESHSAFLLRQINIRKQNLLDRLQEQLDELNVEKERLIMDGLAQEGKQ